MKECEESSVFERAANRTMAMGVVHMQTLTPPQEKCPFSGNKALLPLPAEAMTEEA